MMDGDHFHGRQPHLVTARHVEPKTTSEAPESNASTFDAQGMSEIMASQLDAALPHVLLAIMGAEFSAQGIDALLGSVLNGCHYLVPTAAVGVTLRAEPGQRAASEEQAAAMLELEESLDEGPSIDALRSGVPTVNVSDAERRCRWPVIDPLLRVSGIAAAHAVPLRHRDVVDGVVTVYQRSACVVPDEVVSHLSALANAASLSLERLQILDQMQRRNAQLEHALSSRVVIEQAKGVLAARLAISVDEAFVILRGHARHHQRRLRTVAEAVVAGSLSIQELQCSA